MQGFPYMYYERRLNPIYFRIIYPSSSLHRVEAVRRGQRGVVVLWAQSIRDAGQRALLHKLDQGIQNIRRAVPENGEVDQLLATYNNLLCIRVDL